MVVVMIETPLSSKMVLFCSHQKGAHAFWGKRNGCPQNSGGSGVKDDRFGGDPSAQAKGFAKRGRWGGGSNRSHGPILDATGEGLSPTSKSMERRQVFDTAQRPTHQRDRRGSRRSSGTSENRSVSEAWNHAIAGCGEVPKTINFLTRPSG